MANERGSYGNAAVKDDDKKDGGLLPVLVLAGVTIGVYALSPGARHFYKHGKLPPVAEETAKWKAFR